MLVDYFPILVMAVVAGAIALVFCVLGRLLGPKRDEAQKLAPYECGMWPIGEAQRPLAVKFYVVAMLFILFDVELAFFYPWAVLFQKASLFLFAEMGVFFLILAAAYAYVWRAGGFEWE